MSPPDHPRQRLATLPPAPPVPPSDDWKARVRDLEEHKRHQERTNTFTNDRLESIDGTLNEIKELFKTVTDLQKAETTRRKWLDWATRILLGAALLGAIHWAGKLALIVQSAKIP